MESMREYWAREAEMMRDKSGVLGTNSSPNKNEQNAAKGTITFASEFYSEPKVGVDLLAIAEAISFYKDYVTTLGNQSAYDTYVFSYPAMFTYVTGNGQPASALNFRINGYAEGDGTKGRTILVTDEKNFIQQKGQFGDPDNAWLLKDIKLASIKSSFDSNKKVILVIIANQYLNPEAYPVKKEDFDELKKKSPSSEYDKWWDTVKLDGTHTIIHELIAHAIHHINNDKKTEEEEHEAYHGNKTKRSPGIPEVLSNLGKYQKTTMYKIVQEIKTEIKKR